MKSETMEISQSELTWNIEASPPTGNGRRITLVGTDLIFGGIDNVFVYPTLDVDRFKDALGRTLSMWPILTGRILHNDDDDQHVIEFSDNSVPLTYVEDVQVERWPDLPVVVDDAAKLQPFINSVQYKPRVVVLLRLKITRLVRSNEYILGTSFSHLIGDADSNLHFLRDLSLIYQNLQPTVPHPIFERHSLKDDEDSEFSSLPVMKQYRLADKRETILTRLTKEHGETDPLHLSFTSDQLNRLHQLASGGGSDRVTVHDALCAYVIVLLNRSYFSHPNEYIHRAHILVNFRGVNDVLAPQGQVANSIMQMLSSDFIDCLSLPSVAKSIREAVEMTRQVEFLRKWVATANFRMKQIIKDGRVNFVWDADELVFNSNYKYDWANQVDFGLTDRCRFHTAGLYRFYLRIFRSNPCRTTEGHWARDPGAVEVAFRISKGERQEKFLNALTNDINENFVHVK